MQITAEKLEQLGFYCPGNDRFMFRGEIEGKITTLNLILKKKCRCFILQSSQDGTQAVDVKIPSDTEELIVLCNTIGLPLKEGVI